MEKDMATGEGWQWPLRASLPWELWASPPHCRTQAAVAEADVIWVRFPGENCVMGSGGAHKRAMWARPPSGWQWRGCSQLSQGISSVFRPLGIESHSSKVYQCLPTPGSSPPRVCRQATRVVMTNTIRINKQLINFMYYLNAVSIILLRMIWHMSIFTHLYVYMCIKLHLWRGIPVFSNRHHV